MMLTGLYGGFGRLRVHKARYGRTLEFRKGLLRCKLVSLDDLAWMQIHDEQLLSLLEHLSREDHHAVSRVSHLQLSGLGG